jgi:hypothetical protein
MVDIDFQRVAFDLFAPGVEALLELGAAAQVLGVAHEVEQQGILPP